MPKKSGYIQVSRKKYEKLLQDNEDMHESRCTSFHRCSYCGRLGDSHLICPNCGKDDSIENQENMMEPYRTKKQKMQAKRDKERWFKNYLSTVNTSWPYIMTKSC